MHPAGGSRRPTSSGGGGRILRVMPLVNNFNGRTWEGRKLAEMLHRPEARARAISQALAFVQNGGYSGLSLDFEEIGADAYGDFMRFVDESSVAFHRARLMLSVSVAPDDPRLDYRRLARAADHVILMAYDEHWAGGEPGPIASMGWFTGVLRRRQADLPADHTIVALGNYGYDWRDGYKPAEERTFQEAVLTARESQAEIGFDARTRNPAFRYEDEHGHVHQVWMLDAVSAFNQARLATSLHVAGIALWRLGSEDPSIWEFFGRNPLFDQATAMQLRDISYGYDSRLRGRRGGAHGDREAGAGSPIGDGRPGVGDDHQ